MEATSLKQLFQGMALNEAPQLIQGTVISDSPLRIQIANDSKLVIGEAITIVPRHLTDYETEAEVTWQDNTTEKARLTVHNALKSGETVHIISMCRGKLYYILDRVKA